MAVRIAFHMPNAAPVGDEGIRTAAAFLRQNLELAKSPDTKIDVRVMEKGALSARASFEIACSDFLSLGNSPALVEAIVDSEVRGYDAAIIGCAHDPALREARQRVGIPVVALTQASALFAHLMGANYGIVAISAQARAILQEKIESYGLGKHLAGIAVLGSSLKEQAVAWLDASESAIDDFRTAARALIAAGAEVIYPACGGSSLMLRLTPNMNQYPGGITEIDGVPVIDQLSVAVKIAEIMIALRRAGSPWISRAVSYAKPTDAIVAEASYLPAMLGTIWSA
jgi:Asp/Glu/hydantoin racemase